MLPEIAPLALEKMIVGTMMVFATAGAAGLFVARLQRRHRINAVWSWVIFFSSMLAVIALQGFFQVAERLAPMVQPYMWVFGLVSFGVSAVFWTLCIFTVLGGKFSDLERLFKRR